MRFLPALPVVIPLFGAGLTMVVARSPRLAQLVSLVAVAGTAASSVMLLLVVRADGPAVVHVGGWAPGVGITLVADLFAAIMLVLAGAVVATVLLYALGDPRTGDEAPLFHPVYLAMTAGICLAFLTGDLFNLFVSFEIVLVSSFVLITLGARRHQVRTGMTYVVINLVASVVFVTAVALVYAATGTLNMAELAVRLQDIPAGVRGTLSLVLVVVFGIKAGVFPLYFWLPDSYPTAPTPITAVFAGLLTKVGLYALIRTQTLMFPSDGPSSFLLAVAGLTMVVGVLGAIAQDEIKRILSFNIVGQVGFIVMGLGFFTVAGVTAGVYSIVHHIVVQTTLFLVGGVIETRTGSGALRHIGGLLRRAPVLAVFFAVPALSLAGMPPFSGFVAKLGLVEAGVAVDRPLIVAVSLLVSLLTLVSMVKIWTGVFWGTPAEEASSAPRWPVSLSLASALGVLLVLGVSFAAGPIFEISGEAASALLDRDIYVSEVLER